MTQDFKCFMGIHKLTILEQQEIKDYERPIAKVIISCCTNCGKITTVTASTLYATKNRRIYDTCRHKGE